MSDVSPVRRTPSTARPVPLEHVWFTPAEAATYARKTRKTVYEAIYAGELPSEQRGKPGARHLIHRDAIDAWIRGKPCSGLRPTG